MKSQGDSVAGKAVFTPTLGRIVEDVECHTEENLNDILEEYEILTETDLLVALNLDPKGFKEGQYLSDLKYGVEDETEEDENDEEDGEDSDCFGDEYENIGRNGGLKGDNDFEKLHRRAMEKTKFIFDRFSSIPELDQLSVNRNSMISDTDSIDYLNGDTSSLGSLTQPQATRQRKVSGQSYTSKNGDELLKKYLQIHPGCEFESKNGRKIFVRSILKKYMSIYYVISPPQVLAVEFEDTGISTLLAIRNALKLKDSHLVKEGVSINGGDSANLVTSCLLFDGATSELNFDDFACTARLNDLSVEAILVTKESDIKAFRKDLKLSCLSQDKICVCYYSCHELYQTAGHYFALIGGYFKEKDLVLLFDASRNKIPPFWVPVPVLWKAIQSKTADETTLTDSKLGYFLLEKGDQKPYVILNISTKISIRLSSRVKNYERLINLREQWEKWLLSSNDSSQNVLQNGIQHIMEIINTQTFHSSVMKDEKAKLTYKQGSLVDSLTKTKTFPVVEKFMNELKDEYSTKLSLFAEWVLETVFVTRKRVKHHSVFHGGKKRKKKLIKTDVKMNTFNNTVMVTTWLLFWPYEWRNLDSNCAAIAGYVQADLDTFSPVLLSSFHEQITFVTKVIQSSTKETFKCKLPS